MLLLATLACTPPPRADDSAAPVDWAAPGPWSAGTAPFSLAVEGRDAPVPARVWYPAARTEGDDSLEASLDALVVDEVDGATLAGLLAAAPPGCPTARTVVTTAPPAADIGAAPLVAFSHCHTCLGLSGATIAAHLATHGVVVVAPDHEGNTLFDLLAGDGGSLDEETLAGRARDVSAAIDMALAGDLETPPIDPSRVGVLGHSFGAVTAGRVLATDDRVKAAMAMGAPIDNPLITGVDAASVTEPVLLLLLEEDHSIGAAGNLLIEANHAELGGPAWLARLPDGGHWSVSDLCGVLEGFMPGCGQDTREEGGAEFSYVPADDGRATAAALAAAFFAATLEGDADAEAWLAAPDTRAELLVEVR
ncbi:MAG: dienelactone hydrolase family protein [Pseudomonadota bacterium]|nr:dienelactone hydrolase family protein [Pseudomonadota bacterium]